MAPTPPPSGFGDAAPTPEQLLAHASFVRALARALVRDDAAADDLAQESLLAALERPPRYGSARAWLTGVVRNLARQSRRGDERRRARERLVTLAPPPPPATPRESAERLELFARIVAAVQQLDEPYREAITRRYFDGAEAAEIAGEQGLPIETVRTRLKRGLERLRSALDETAGGRARWSAIALTTFAETVAVTTKSKLLLAAAALVVAMSTIAVWTKLASRGGGDGGAATSGATHASAAVDGAGTPTSALLPATRATEPAAAAPASDPGASWIVRGRVHADAAVPRPHVRVRARLWDGLARTETPRLDVRLSSDDAGEVAWPLPAPATAVVVALDPDQPDSYQFGSERFVAAGVAAPQDFDLTCYALDGEIEGIVFGSDGTPAHDAEVSVLRRTIDCDEHGEFTAKVPAGARSFRDFQVIGWAPGSAETMAMARPGPVGERARVEIHLTPGFSVRGRITDAAGAPITGATVASFGLRVSKGTSDAHGDYCLDHVPAHDAAVTIDAFADGFARTQVEVAGGGGDTRADFVLKRGVTVRGRVVAPDGKPAAGAAVVLAFDPSAYDKLATHAEEDGAFEIRGARSIRAQLYVYVEWKGAAPFSQPYTIPDGSRDGAELDEVVLQLSASHFAAGRVEDESGRPVAGVYVTFQKGRGSQDCYGRSDANGAFRVDALPDGPFMMRAYGDGWAELRQDAVAVDRGDLRVVMRRSGRAAGRVVDGASGQAIGRFKVRFCGAKVASGEDEAHFYSSDWREAGRTFVDANGRFAIGGDASMLPGAILGIEVSAEGYAPTIADHVVLAAEPDPDALVVELFRGGALKGLVVDARDGRPVADALIKLVNDQLPLDPNHDSYANSRPATRSDERGRFRLERIPLGKASLVVEHKDFARAFDDGVEIPRGSTAPARTIRLTRGSALTGVVLGDDGRPLAGATIDVNSEITEPTLRGGGDRAAMMRALSRNVSRQATSDSAGRFTFTQLPPGRYHVSRSEHVDIWRVRALEVVVDLSDDASRDVRLGPAGGATLRVVLHSDGEPRAGLLVRIARVETAPNEWPSFLRESLARDGRCEFGGLAAGRYRITAFGGNGLDAGAHWQGTLDTDVAEDAAVEATVEVAKTR